jgi:hypothetical protein
VSQRSTYSGVFVCAQLQLAPLAPLKTMLIKRSDRWAGTKVPLRWDGCPELTGRRWAAIPRVPHFGQARHQNESQTLRKEVFYKWRY